MKVYLSIILASLLFFSCNLIENITTETETDPSTAGDFYVLNEGNMLAHQCTLDFFDATTKTYTQNILQGQHPGETGIIGDVGNDLQLYDGRIYAVINGSNKVEVYEASDHSAVGTLSVNCPRYIVFDGDGYAYISTYDGTVERYELSTLKHMGSVKVGLLPEKMAIYNGKLYVANSGDFMDPNYQNTISVIDITSFTLSDEINADIQLHHIAIDSKGTIWVSSRGNYADKAACLISYARKPDGNYERLYQYDIPVANMALCGNKLYYIAASYDERYNATYNFGTIDTDTFTHNSDSYITDGTEKNITTPYAIVPRPDGSFFITDVAGYSGMGHVLEYTSAGRLIHDYNAGQIPGHIVFVE